MVGEGFKGVSGYGTDVGVYGFGLRGVEGISFTREDGIRNAGVTGVNFGSDCDTTGPVSGYCIGVYGEATAGSASMGVYGRGITWGVYSQGNLGVAGNATITGTCFCTLSDGRLKRDVGEAPYGLAEVLALKPVTYRWEESRNDNSSHAGFIAQDAMAIAPELVLTAESGDLYVDPMAFISLLTRAIQEQQAMIEGLEGTGPVRAASGPSGPVIGRDAGLAFAGALFGGLALVAVTVRRRGPRVR